MIQDVQLHDTLAGAIADYDYPPFTYDFGSSKEQRWSSTHEVESEIGHLLRSSDLAQLKNGISNVLYWGYYTSRGRRDHRVRTFRTRVGNDRLEAAAHLFRTLRGPGLVQIRQLGLPGFSGGSFITKLRMFLDPTRYVVMDLNIARLKYARTPTLFRHLKWRRGDTSIRITKHNEGVYENWCEWCRRVAAMNFASSGIRAVDVERGIFRLIRTSKRELAADILAAEI